MLSAHQRSNKREASITASSHTQSNLLIYVQRFLIQFLPQHPTRLLADCDVSSTIEAVTSNVSIQFFHRLLRLPFLENSRLIVMSLRRLTLFIPTSLTIFFISPQLFPIRRLLRLLSCRVSSTEVILPDMLIHFDTSTDALPFLILD